MGMFDWNERPREEVERVKREREEEDAERFVEYPNKNEAEYKEILRESEAERAEDDRDRALSWREKYPNKQVAPDEMGGDPRDEMSSDELDDYRYGHDYSKEKLGQEAFTPDQRDEKRHEFKTPLTDSGKAGGPKNSGGGYNEQANKLDSMEDIYNSFIKSKMAGVGQYDPNSLWANREVDRIGKYRDAKNYNQGLLADSLINMQAGVGTHKGVTPSTGIKGHSSTAYQAMEPGTQSSGIPKEVLDFLKQKEQSRQFDEEMEFNYMYPGSKGGNNAAARFDEQMTFRKKEQEYQHEQDRIKRINSDLSDIRKTMNPIIKIMSHFTQVDETIGVPIEDVKFVNGDPFANGKKIEGYLSVGRLGRVEWGPKAEAIRRAMSFLKDAHKRESIGSARTEGEMEDIEKLFSDGSFNNSEAMFKAFIQYKQAIARDAAIRLHKQSYDPESLEVWNSRNGLSLKDFGKTGSYISQEIGLDDPSASEDSPYAPYTGNEKTEQDGYKPPITPPAKRQALPQRTKTPGGPTMVPGKTALRNRNTGAIIYVPSNDRDVIRMKLEEKDQSQNNIYEEVR